MHGGVSSSQLSARRGRRPSVRAQQDGAGVDIDGGQHGLFRCNRTSFGGRQVDRLLRGAHVGVREVCGADEIGAIVRLVANAVGVALVPQTASRRRWPAAIRADGEQARDVTCLVTNPSP